MLSIDGVVASAAAAAGDVRRLTDRKGVSKASTLQAGLEGRATVSTTV